MYMWRERLPQRAVASRLGLTQGALSLKLRGKRPWHLHEVYEVASILGVEPADLMPPTRQAAVAETLPQVDSNHQHFDYWSRDEGAKTVDIPDEATGFAPAA